MSKKVNSYTDEFKAEAVRLIDEHDGNVSAAARSLGIAMHEAGKASIEYARPAARQGLCPQCV